VRCWCVLVGSSTAPDTDATTKYLSVLYHQQNENVTFRAGKQNKIRGKRGSIPIRRISDLAPGIHRIWNSVSCLVLSLVKGMEWNWKRESKDEAHAELRSNVSK
jgi:hypothetical protein